MKPEQDKPKPGPALENKNWAAPAIGYTEERTPSGDEAAAKPTKRSFTMETSDIVAIGVVILALGAVLIAVIIAVAFAFGAVPGKEAAEIILGCVGGFAVSLYLRHQF